MWEIEDQFALAEGTDPEAIKTWLVAELGRMARTSVDADGDTVRFSVSPGRWWRAPVPFDMIDKGVLRIDCADRVLMFRLSMRRMFLGACFAATLLGVFWLFANRGSWFGALFLAGVAFAWLGGLNYFLAHRRATGYLRKLAAGAG